MYILVKMKVTYCHIVVKRPRALDRVKFLWDFKNPSPVFPKGQHLLEVS